jgi:hypothetical protein
MSTEQETLQAFEAAFADEQAEPATPAASDNQTPDAAPAPEPEKSASQPEDADPFAGLSPEVRSLLAETQRQRVDINVLKSQAGRIAALQSKIDQLESARTAPPPAAPAAPAARRFEKADKLRADGLPEIADALDELAAALPQPKGPDHPEPVPQTTKAPPSDSPTPAEEILTDLRPTWGQELMSDDFQLWLSRQSAEHQQEVRGTSKPGVILRSLQQWDQSKARHSQSSTPQSAPNRQQRIAAAMTPRGDGQRTRAAGSDAEQAAFMTGFNTA